MFNIKTVLFSGGIAILCTVLPDIFYTLSLSGLETGMAAILVTVEPLVATLLGFFLWKEDVSVLKIIGIILIFGSVLLLGTKKSFDE
jgi:drug/metabolite transporter (DMT)-like permease